MNTLIDLTGQKFGSLLALERSPLNGRIGRWVCRCECGEIRTVLAGNLLAGRSRSCGNPGTHLLTPQAKAVYVMGFAILRRLMRRATLGRHWKKHPEKKREKDRQYHVRNREKSNAANREWYAKNKEDAKFKAGRRAYALHRKYGLSPEQYDRLLATQGGACALCGTEPNGTRLHVDHDHATERIRGLLCWSCNYRLLGPHNKGAGPELYERAALYLRSEFDGRAL